MSGHDVIVIGAGHNGLTAAATLARAGRSVLVLERGEQIGGLAAAEEFQPGYRSAGLFHDTTGVRPGVVRALDLERHGLVTFEQRAELLALGEEGDALYLPGEPAGDAAAIGARTPRDGERYGDFQRLLDAARPIVARQLDSPPLDLLEPRANRLRELAGRALGLRRLGARRMLEFLRVPPMSVADWLDEWFADPLLKSALAHGAVLGCFHGPRSPGSAIGLLLQLAGGGVGVRGGGPALVAALEAACVAAGVELRTSATVASIRVGPTGVEGVRLADGEELSCRALACACDPVHALLELLPAGAIGARLEQRLRCFRARGTTAQLLLALSGPVRFTRSGDRGAAISHARTGETIDRIEQAFDAVKYDEVPERPVLDIHLPTLGAPEGHSVISVLIHFVPRRPDGGWTSSRVDALRDHVLEQLSPHVEGLDRLEGAVLSTPLDLEERHGLRGGQIHHGEHALDQLLVRPAPECSGYATPVDGLFLCGGGSHPGGGLSCAPGALGARALLER